MMIIMIFMIRVKSIILELHHIPLKLYMRKLALFKHLIEKRRKT